MAPLFQGINKKILCSRLTDSRRLPNITVMMTELTKPPSTQSKQLYKLPSLFFSLEAVRLKKSALSPSIRISVAFRLCLRAEPLPMPPMDAIQSAVPLDRRQVDALMEENLKKLELNFPKRFRSRTKSITKGSSFFFSNPSWNRSRSRLKTGFSFYVTRTKGGFTDATYLPEKSFATAWVPTIG